MILFFKLDTLLLLYPRNVCCFPLALLANGANNLFNPALNASKFPSSVGGRNSANFLDFDSIVFATELNLPGVNCNLGICRGSANGCGPILKFLKASAASSTAFCNPFRIPPPARKSVISAVFEAAEPSNSAASVMLIPSCSSSSSSSSRPTTLPSPT